MQKLVNNASLLFRKSLYILPVLCLAGLMACAGGGDKKPHPSTAKKAADTELKLPAGFTAVTVIDGLRAPRHIAVAPNGVVFVKLNGAKDGKTIYRLRDTNGDG